MAHGYSALSRVVVVRDVVDYLCSFNGVCVMCVNLDRLAVSERELLLTMRLLLSMGIAAYNSGLSISLAELHSLESDICELQSQMISL